MFKNGGPMKHEEIENLSREELQKRMDEKVKGQLLDSNSGNALDDLMKHILDGFAYRYIETPLNENIMTQKDSNGSYFVSSKDNRLIEVLKVTNRDLKNKLIEFAKTTTPKDGATVAYRIMVSLVHGDFENGGKVKLEASFDWDFPKHQFDTEKTFHQSKELEFEDVLFIRNKLPYYLDKVCDIFL